MSYEASLTTISMEAENAMTEAFVVVELGAADGQVDLPSATTDIPFGVIQNTAGANQAVSVAISGVTQVVTGGAVAAGARLSIASTTGRVDDAATSAGTEICGIALEASSADGEIIPMKITAYEVGA